MTFKNYDDYIYYLKNRKVSIEEKVKWNGNYLKDELKNYCKVIKPKMPCSENVNYKEWKIHFERFFDLLGEKIILVGSSFGGTFLCKYFSENIFPKKIIALYLICPAFDDTMIGEDLAGGLELKEDLSLINKNCSDIKFFFSKDDDCVPISHADKYKNKLPNANYFIYESKNGHFNVEEFPEIIKIIKEDLDKNNSLKIKLFFCKLFYLSFNFLKFFILRI